MAAQTEPRSGIFYGWTFGETGWNVGMDENLKRIGRFAFHLSIKDRDLATPPGSPAEGDTYIIAASATDDWAGKEGQIAVWVPGTPSGAWAYATPRTGWVCFIEDEVKLAAFYGGVWSAGIAI
jgi:hypothetical protein